MEICNQFRRLDPSNCGHITLPHLLEGRSWQNNYENISNYFSTKASGEA
jgi:hypothetical protein